MANVDDPTIPLDCADFGAPDVDFSDGCAPELNTGFWRYMIVSHAPWAAVNSATEYATRLALPATDPTAMREFIVEANMPAGTPGTTRYNLVDYPTPGPQVANIIIKETTQKNYEFARSTQGGYKAHVWFLDQNRKYIYGGLNGVGSEDAVLRLAPLVPAGETDLHTIEGTLNYTSLYAPKRDVSAI